MSALSSELWRLNNLYYIKDDKGNKILFKMNWAQQLLYRSMWYLNIILKARQLGMTTFIQIFMLDRCLFNDNTNAGVIAQTQKDAESFFDEKIKFAYDNLPADLKAMLINEKDSTTQLKFNNGSRIVVGTSLRSGTYQYLHISEFGKVCATDVKRAKEIVTGALNTVAVGCFVFIESTAEGRTGQFFEMCQESMKLALSIEMGESIMTEMDYKFWFFPWYKHPKYVLHGVQLREPPEMRDYFEQLEIEHGVELSTPQRAWYIKKAAKQGEDMKREFPSTPEEAFEKLLKGAIFGEQIKRARKEYRICKLPFERHLPVNTFWDLGRNDHNVIWFHQRVGAWNHFIHYYEARLLDLAHYIEILFDLKQERGFIYGHHYLPHDGKNTDLSAAHNLSREHILNQGGVKPTTVVPRVQLKNTAIEAARTEFGHCRFDSEHCAEGIIHLENYQWTWDEVNDTFRKTPLHNVHSNGADGYMTFAQGYRGERSSIRDQLAEIDGTARRAYMRGKARNPLTNPSNDHIV